MTQTTTNVVIIGAGPYGLSLASHLRSNNVKFRIFGDPMRFWRDLPKDINLKSPAISTNISLPVRHTFSEWCRRQGLEDYEPCSMASFANYGLWIQQNFIPEVEAINVVAVTQARHGFDITLENGVGVEAKNVVVATGLSCLASIPRTFGHLPTDLVSHTFNLTNYSRFSRKHVAVIGGGASAVEAGALIHEAGGTPEVFARGSRILIYDRSPRERGLRERILQPSSPIGNGRLPYLMTRFPMLTYLLPQARRLRLLKGFVPPSAPWWIRDRVVGLVPLHTGRSIVEAQSSGRGVRLTIRDTGGVDTEMEFDEVVAGTGYDKDVGRLAFLDDALRKKIRVIERAPELSPKYESSVKGLYFVGPLSEASFGPISRFVAGADYASRTLSMHLRKQQNRNFRVARIRRGDLVDVQ